MQYELKSVGVWAFTKVSFFFNLVVGFIFGFMYALLFSFLMAVMSQFPGLDTGEFDLGGMSLGVMMIVMPFMFSIGGAVFNTLVGLIVVIVYNLIARIVGGLELNLELIGGQTQQVAKQPLTAYTTASSHTPASTVPPETQTPTPEPPPPDDNKRSDPEND